MTVVAIDGPAGAGKSTVARALARRLGFTYLDTGAMYRAVALGALRAEEGTAELARRAAEVAARSRLEVGERVRLDGEDVTEAIRAPAVSEAAVKVYLTADPRERARRRAAELGADPEQVLAEQAIRDARDRSREHSPLRPAPDAVELDTTGLSVEQAVERVAALIRQRTASAD